MENSRKKKIKIIVITVITLLIIIIGVTIGVGNYFVNYAIARSGDGGDRQVKNDMSIAQETEDIIQENKNETKQQAEEWSENITSKEVEITANDGIKLKGKEYIVNEENNKWAIILHGYRSTPESVLTIGQHFSEKDYNVLIPNMRGCGESEGEYIGMGWLDKDDLQEWIKLIVNQNQNSEIVLHGSSMGAATVLMASGDELPSNVKAIIADSGYTSVWDIFASEAKKRFNIPKFPVLNMFQIVAKVRARYDIKKASALEQVKKSKTPILFIHGDEDTFVYPDNASYNYAICKAPKELIVVNGARHISSVYVEPDLYKQKLLEFFEKYD